MICSVEEVLVIIRAAEFWEKLLDFDKIDFVPTRRTSVLSVFSLRKLRENQDLISSKQPKREEKIRVEFGLEDK